MRNLVILSVAVAAMAMVPASALAQSSGDYPLCTSPGQDHCQNPGEGGAPGRSRAADYPGGPPVYASDDGENHASYHSWHNRHRLSHRSRRHHH